MAWFPDITVSFHGQNVTALDGMSFNVIQHFAKVAFTLFDLLRAERLFEDVSVHGASPS
jgi:hypothetical protein